MRTILSKIRLLFLVVFGLERHPDVIAAEAILLRAHKLNTEERPKVEREPLDWRSMLARHGITAHVDSKDPESLSSWIVKTTRPGRLAFALSEDGELPTVEKGHDGTKWSAELPSTDPNSYFRPVKVRGLRSNHGDYYKLFLTSTTYRRGVSNISQALTTGSWKVRPGVTDDMTEEEIAEATERAAWTERALLHNLEGGWSQFINDWTYLLIGGFALFETVYYGEDEEDEEKRFGIRKLAFRNPSTVKGWVQDERERDLEYIKLVSPSDSEEVLLPACDSLLFSYNRFGNNYEGISPLRSATRWIESLQMLQVLEMAAAEVHGVPWKILRDGDHLDADENKQVIEDMTAATAQEAPMFNIGKRQLDMISPNGNMPDFEPGKRFNLERIGEILKAEGSLIGLGQTGAFAARASADGEFIRSAPYFGKLVCDPINGVNNTPYTGIIPRMEAAKFGEPLRPGVRSRLEYSVGELEDASYAQRLVTLQQSGLITATPEVVAHVHEKEGLPDPPKNVEPEPVEEPAMVALVPPVEVANV